jgi:hypothetical protein
LNSRLPFHGVAPVDELSRWRARLTTPTAMKRTPEQLPDPWLFDSEALLKQLDRCRELVVRIPITDTQDIHFGINIAVDAIWNLQEQLRFLLRLPPRWPETNRPRTHAAKPDASNRAPRQQDRFSCSRATRPCFAKNRGHCIASARSYRPAAQNPLRGISTSSGT